MKNEWAIDVCTVTPSDRMDYDVFRALALGHAGIVVIRGLLDADTLDRGKASINQLLSTSTTTNYTNGSLTTIGPYLARYLSAPQAYFNEVERVTRMFR